MNYYFLKLGAGNENADKQLGAKQPVAAIYFDGMGQAAYEAGKGASQARLFWERGRKENWADTVMVVIHDGRVLLLQPCGPVRFREPFQRGRLRLTEKRMPVRNLRDVACKDDPPVLIGLPSSQKHGRRTFTEIDHWGESESDRRCLGSNGVRCCAQRATLAARRTARSPASGMPRQHRTRNSGRQGSGSQRLPRTRLPRRTLKDIDVLAYNDHETEINIGGLKAPARGRVSKQVKTWKNIDRPKAVDYLIGLDVIQGPGAFDADWILARVKEQPAVLAWLRRSLNWLPPAFLELFGLAEVSTGAA